MGWAHPSLLDTEASLVQSVRSCAPCGKRAGFHIQQHNGNMRSASSLHSPQQSMCRSTKRTEHLRDIRNIVMKHFENSITQAMWHRVATFHGWDDLGESGPYRPAITAKYRKELASDPPKAQTILAAAAGGMWSEVRRQQAGMHADDKCVRCGEAGETLMQP